MQVRTVKTASDSIAVQVIRYENRKRIVVKHIGSARDNVGALRLKSEAHRWIAAQSGQLDVFNTNQTNNDVENFDLVGLRYDFFYEIIACIQKIIGYDKLGSQFIQDLVTIRLFEPASKLRSIELLQTYFGIKAQRKQFYKETALLDDLQNKASDITLRFAQSVFGSDFTLVFYDVTTLYFETFEEDDFRKTGFSKDNKPQQPQVLIGLLVNKEGFPLSYEMFAGNSFEGHTMMPAIKSFQTRLGIKNFTVIADAAMISAENIASLKAEQIHYIVGARLGNISAMMLQNIDTGLTRLDGQHIRLRSDPNIGYLICSYSEKRYKKDKYEMEKQIARAKKIVEQPGTSKKVKYVKAVNEKLEVNDNLIAKTTKLLGIKGYYTDLPEDQLSSQLVIDRYHELYKIELAFRISKHDLKARPVYHYKQASVRLHILICFMALVVSKYIEIKTNQSNQAFLKELKKITTAILKNTKTGHSVKKTNEIPGILQGKLAKLNLPH